MPYGEKTTNTFTPLASQAAAAIPVPTGNVGGAIAADTTISVSNPPFALAKKSNPLITQPGEDARITRGYIRRDFDPQDPTSRFRLNFMFNPESIQRNYIAYLAQGALDPYNTIYQAGNLVVPPGILDFEFELLFDRQIEANRPGDRGTNVDYDYFERVIRAVEPTAPPAINNIPDNGVLMINPRTTTVVFSEQFQVQGKIHNAVVSYDKFTHEMVPTRMRIGLQMKVVYIGTGLPSNQAFDLNIVQSTATYAATVPYENKIGVNVTYSGDVDSFNAKQGDFDGLGLDLGGWSTDGDSHEGESASGGSGSAGGGSASPGTPIPGITYPPNIGTPSSGNIYQMPDPDPEGLYIFSPGTPPGERGGSKALIGVIYSVAQKWKETYPNTTLRIGDLNAGSGHVSHKKGVDVDITTSDRSAANVSGNREKSIQLGKWFIDTGIIKLILYNDVAVQTAVNAYAQQVRKPGRMQSYSGHDDHFHVRILDEYIAYR